MTMNRNTSLFEPHHDPAIKEIDQKIYDTLVGKPGEYPYTRGIYREMYAKNRFPTVRKYSGFGTAGELNSNLREQIQLGVTGLSIAYDLPTQMGLDPDDSLAQGEVGINGVSVASLHDYEIAFEGILKTIVEKDIGVSKTINATAPILLMMYLAVAKKQGVDPKQLRGTIQNDVLKEYLARNTFIYPLGGTLRLVRDVFAFAKDNLPRFNTISISGYHMREKGSTAAQELAYMFANAIQYVVTAIEAGLSVDKFAPQLSFFINIKKDIFEEVAKLRAARRIWAQIMKEGFEAKNPRSHQWRVQAYTGGSDLRREKPHNNITRDAVRTLTAVLGGPQGINTTSFDEAISIPSKLSEALAIDTAYVIFFEKEITNIVDPFAGSYYLETKTNALEHEVWLELEKIAQQPSYQKALAYMTCAIEERAQHEQIEEDQGLKKIVGKNIFTENASLFPTVELFSQSTPFRASTMATRTRKFAELKRKRDAFQVSLALDQLEVAARDADQNLMPYLLLAVESYATIGEISRQLGKVFGFALPEEPWHPGVSIRVFNQKIRSLIQEKSNVWKNGFQGRAVASSEADALKIPYVGKVAHDRVEHPGTYPYTRGLTPRFESWAIRTSETLDPKRTIGGYQYREAGATATQELAFALFHALRWFEKKLSAVSSVDMITSSPWLILASHNNFMEEMAKFRVARRLWAKLLKERWNVADENVLKLNLHVKTSASALVRTKPWNNIVRTTLQALQAALGGVQSLEITPFDAPFGQTEWSDWARQLSIDTHGILLYEVGLGEHADPLGGCFYLEGLTEQLEEAVHNELTVLESLPSGEAGQRIRSSLLNLKILQARATAGEVNIVGLNVQKEGPNPQPKPREKQ